MKKWSIIALVTALPFMAGFLTLYAASGTPVKNAAFIMKIAKPCNSVLILNNRTGQVVYYKLNDAETTPVCSASAYDICLDNLESEVLRADLLKNNPVQAVGVFCADTTPTAIRIVGF